jgi:hypothetical protein
LCKEVAGEQDGWVVMEMKRISSLPIWYDYDHDGGAGLSLYLPKGKEFSSYYYYSLTESRGFEV